MSVDIVVFGGLRIDYLITAGGEVALRRCGGNALFAAVGARVWGARVGIVARAGQNFPQTWINEAEGGGIDTQGVRWLAGDVEMRTFFAHAPDGGRAEGDPHRYFSGLGQPVPDDLATYTQATADQEDAVYAPLWLQPEDIPAVYYAAHAFHLAPMNWEAQMSLAAALRAQGARRITLDPGEAYMVAERRGDVQTLLAQVDVFLPSEMEVALLLGDVSAEAAARQFAAWGPGLVVIKRGAAGCLVYEAATERVTHVPSVASRVRDVTGAGDAFCGGFLVGLEETGDAVLAARWGAVTAAYVVEDFGALYALRYGRAAAEARLASHAHSP